MIRRSFEEVWNEGSVGMAEEFSVPKYGSHNHLSVKVDVQKQLRQVATHE